MASRSEQIERAAAAANAAIDRQMGGLLNERDALRAEVAQKDKRIAELEGALRAWIAWHKYMDFAKPVREYPLAVERDRLTARALEGP